MKYKIVDFPPCANAKTELKSIIDREAVDGYEYAGHQYSDKMQPGSSGCFGIGARPATTVHIGMVVFKKK
ncbi:MAG: hypothetical protein HWE22_06225 [Flavobacteriales bacterium]|nr:hypothetical protein [Flavobacteriales bacterium]